jgi:prolyl-tRNA editing enzyme YbaK/EbsC (Cys-tRNA(Pro) deacylase)
MDYANTVGDFLERHHVAHEVVSHARTGSSLESARVAQVPPERVAKGVLLHANGKYLLAVTRADCHLDLDELRRQLQLSVELATPEDAGKRVRRLCTGCGAAAGICLWHRERLG